LIFFLVRHAESVLNLEHRVNGDPAVPAPLTERGREEAELLGAQLAHVELDLCVHTRFQRTAETAALALGGRQVPVEVEPLLDDIDIGALEGKTLDDYREAKQRLGRKQRFPEGESLDEAALRYAQAFRRLGQGQAQRVLVVCHEIPVRYALNGAAGAEALDGPPFHLIPNAMPFLFEGRSLVRAAARIEELAA
jgi:broad specificity phosphatase PhoE